jgi:hypothetical protein
MATAPESMTITLREFWSRQHAKRLKEKHHIHGDLKMKPNQQLEKNFKRRQTSG